MDKDNLDSAKQYAFRLLGYRQRSRSELSERLKRKGMSDSVVKKVLETLDRTGYIDDERFARDFVENRLSTNPAGRRYFRAELYKKKVPAEIVERVVEEALTDEIEYEAAYNLMLKLLSRTSSLSREEKIKKAYAYLGRKGFSAETTADVLNSLGADHGED